MGKWLLKWIMNGGRVKFHVHSTSAKHVVYGGYKSQIYTSITDIWAPRIPKMFEQFCNNQKDHTNDLCICFVWMWMTIYVCGYRLFDFRKGRGGLMELWWLCDLVPFRRREPPLLDSTGSWARGLEWACLGLSIGFWSLKPYLFGIGLWLLSPSLSRSVLEPEAWKLRNSRWRLILFWNWEIWFN